MSEPNKNLHVDPSGTVLPEGHSIPSRQRPDPQLPDELLALETLCNVQMVAPNPVLRELGISPKDRLDTIPIDDDLFFDLLCSRDLLAGRKLTPEEEKSLFEREPSLRRKAILMGAREVLTFFRDELNTIRFRKTYFNAVMETELHRALARTAMRLLAAWDQVMLEEFVGPKQPLEAVAS